MEKINQQCAGLDLGSNKENGVQHYEEQLTNQRIKYVNNLAKELNMTLSYNMNNQLKQS